MYVVITYPQTGGSPDLDSWCLFTELADAQAERDGLEAATKAVGRGERHVVAEVTPIESEDNR